MLDKQIQNLMYHTIQLERFVSYSGGGTPTYDDPEVVKGNIVGETKAVRTLEGEEATSTITAFLSGTWGDVDYKDRITLPDGRQPPILGIQRHYNEHGKLSLVEVNL